MPPDVPVEFTVFPDDCDSYGHLNQAALVRLFERARWSVMAGGPGIDVFGRHGVWPAVRKSVVEYRAQAFPGDVLRLDLALSHHGHTSFTMRQTATRAGDDSLVAEGEFVFVCIGSDGRPAPVPAEISRFLGARPSQRPGDTRRLIVHGTSIAVDVLGDRDPLLFVHGFPLDRMLWRPVTATLTGWQRVAPDLPGFGQSAMPDGDRTMTTYADDLVGILDTLRIERAVVAGHSMGGYVAFEMWRRHPGRVRALVLMNTRAAPDDEEARERRNAMVTRVRRDGTGSVADDMIPRLLAGATRMTEPRIVERVRAMIAGTSSEGAAQALRAMRDRQDARPLLRTISVPTLVITGRDDQIVPSDESRAMAEGIRGAHLAVVPDAGHLAALEQPLHVSRIIGEFLEGLS